MKYALIENNQIKVGPRDYSKGIFELYLTKNSVDFTMPWRYNTNEVLQVAEGISLVPTQDPEIPSHHSITEQLAGPYWTITDTLVTGTYSVADVPLDAAKNKMKEFIADARYTKEVSGTTVTVQDTEVSIGTGRGFDRDVWYQALASMGSDDTKLFKFQNTWLQLTKTDVETIVSAINTHVQGAFEWENTKVQIAESADKAGLETLYSDLQEELNPTPAEE